MQKFTRLVSAALSLGLALTACNLSENAPPQDSTPALVPSTGRATPLSPADAKAFEQERVALKARETDPEKLDAGMRAIAARYGFPIEAAGIPGPVNPMTLDGNGAPTASLGKIAAAQATRWYMAKDIEFGVTQAFKRSVEVPNGGVMDMITSHDPSTSGVDPYLVAFIQPPINTSDLAKIKFIAISDDDAGGLDAHFHWTNTTGKTQIITFVAHAYASYATGIATLTLSCHAPFGVVCGDWSVPVFMGGNAVRFNTETTASGCKGPNLSNISLNINKGSGYGPILMAVNVKTLRGGFADVDGTVQLDDVLTSNAGANFVIGFTLSDGRASAGSYTGFQGNNYSCP